MDDFFDCPCWIFFLVSLPFVETITRRPKSISTSMRVATFRPSLWFSGTQLQNLTATGDTGKATHMTLKRPKRSVTCQKASISTPLGKNDVPDIGQKGNHFFLQSVWSHVKVWPIFPLDLSCWVQFHSDDWSVILCNIPFWNWTYAKTLEPLKFDIRFLWLS